MLRQPVNPSSAHRTSGQSGLSNERPPYGGLARRSGSSAPRRLRRLQQARVPLQAGPGHRAMDHHPEATLGPICGTCLERRGWHEAESSVRRRNIHSCESATSELLYPPVKAPPARGLLPRAARSCRESDVRCRPSRGRLICSGGESFRPEGARLEPPAHRPERLS